jgi:hypothetical protein
LFVICLIFVWYLFGFCLEKHGPMCKNTVVFHDFRRAETLSKPINLAEFQSRPVGMARATSALNILREPERRSF